MSTDAAPRLISADLARLLRRRLADLLGLVAALVGLTLAVALASHDPADASLNTATGEPVVNLAGRTGAMVSDAALQGLGLAAWLLVAVPLGWAFALVARGAVGAPLVRFACLLAALPLVAASLALLPLGGWGALPAGPGGVAGPLVRDWTLGLGHAVLGPLGAVFAALFTLGLAVALSFVAIGLSPLEWRRAGVAAARGTGGLFRRARSAATAARSWAQGVIAAFRRPAPREEPALRREPRLGPDPVIDEPAPAPPSAPPPRAPRPRVDPPAEPRRAAAQGTLPLAGAGWVPPPLSLLAEPPATRPGRPSPESLEANARMLEGVLSDFGVQGRIVAIRPGPVVTLYELEPAPGTKSSRVIGLADDIARSMSAISVRVAVVPGRNAIGIELPNTRRETVYLSELLGSEEWAKAKGRLDLALGKDIGGAPVIVDLAGMPHLLIAGTTGAGKSVAINTMILSILMRHPPEECRFIMIDPKMLELSVYDRIPHLLAPVVTEPAKAIGALKWAVREMERRYRLMSQLGVRNIAGYNARVTEARSRGETPTRRVQTGFDPETGRPVWEDQPLSLDPLPFIVVVVDEMADLMIVAGKEIEAAVQRLAQMARAAGIHILMATQRPSVDVITGVIKANFPTRISFRVVGKVDSRTILGEQGAEQLLGQGDMLYMAGGGRITRVHGPFVSDGEVEAVVAHLRELGEPEYLDEVTEADASAAAGEAALPGMGGPLAGEESDETSLYDRAVDLVAREGKASTSFIQRHLQIGYNRAARLIEQMEKEGVVGPPNHVGKREILVRRPDTD
jgi:S-DNA-T family DNA segregation ATPase FtsK/SpoIIIE